MICSDELIAGNILQRATRWDFFHPRWNSRWRFPSARDSLGCPSFPRCSKGTSAIVSGGTWKKIFFFKILKSNNSQESAIKKISNFPSLFRKRLSFCRENQVEKYEIEVQSPLGVKVKVRCTLTFKKHLCFQKAPMSPKTSWSAKNHLARQKSSWPGKKHRARQKSPALPKSTRPSGRFCTLFLKDIDSSTGTYLPGSPHGQGSGHLWKSKTFIQCLRIRTRQVLDAQIMISLRSADTEHVRRLFWIHESTGDQRAEHTRA